MAEAVITILTIAVYVFGIAGAVKKKKGKDSSAKSVLLNHPRGIIGQMIVSADTKDDDTEAIKVPESSRKAAGSVKVSTRELSASLEDRRHDWLARQLAEERTIEKRGSMLDLGAGHRDNCDSKNIKLQHIFEHGKY